MRHLSIGISILVFGCHKSTPKPAPIEQSPASAARGVSVAELYATCEERVEGVSVPGECSVDADCVKTGCSSETCVAQANVQQGQMGTCEVLPCFSVLDTCGCVEGMCSWALKDSVPTAGPLKGFLPPTPSK